MIKIPFVVQDSFWKQFTVPSYIKRLIIWVCVFLQFYPLKFTFLPVACRVMISALGGLFFILQGLRRVSKGLKIEIDKRFIKLVFPLFILSLFSLVSLIFNGTHDISYLIYFITPILMMSSAYFTVYFMYWCYGDRLSFQIIAYYCSIIVFAQLIFGILSYVTPALVQPILVLTQEGLDQLGSLESGRFKGLGVIFMNMGVANGVGLLLMAILLKNAKTFHLDKWVQALLIFLFIVISVLGNMQARSTSICAGLAMGFLVISSVKLNLHLLRSGLGKLITAIFICLLLLGFVVYFFGDYLEHYKDALAYGFELFDSVAAGKGAQTKSSNMLGWMLTIWPRTELGWLIGYGHYEGFYYRTDVGYARLVFYFGVFGTAVYYFYEALVTYMAFKNIAYLWKSMWFYMLLMLLIVNVKSFTEYTHYVALFLVFNIVFKDRLNINHSISNT